MASRTMILNGATSISVQEASKQFGIPERTIHNSIDRLFPGFKQNGKPTYLSMEKIAAIVEDLRKSHNSELASSGKVITTDLEMQQKAMEVMAWMGQKIKDMQDQLADARPKIEFFDAVTNSKDAIEMKDAAKVLNIGMGRTTLFQFLRDKKILMDNNTPYQEYIDRGYFRVIESKWVTPEGDTKINLKTVVYQKGLDFIRKAAMK